MPNDDARPAAGPTGHEITRREAVRRVGALLGGIAFVGGSGLLAACERADRPAAVADGKYKPVGQFTAPEIELLDEIADTILPTTAKSPGAKAAAVGPFMALMVTDTYRAPEQQVFRDGMRRVNEATRAAHQVDFLKATPAQRLAVLGVLDREQKTATDARQEAEAEAARRGVKPKASGPQAPPEGTSAQIVASKAASRAAAGKEAAGDSADKNLSDQRQENAGTGDIASGAATADAPPHFFRMMKELAMLGYFTSEIGYTKAMRYVESPGRYDPCVPYAPGDRAWAPHA